MPLKSLEIRIKNDPDLANEIANSAVLFILGQFWTLTDCQGSDVDMRVKLADWNNEERTKWWNKEQVLIQMLPDKTIHMIHRDHFYNCKLIASSNSAAQPSAAVTKDEAPTA